MENNRKRTFELMGKKFKFDPLYSCQKFQMIFVRSQVNLKSFSVDK